MAEINFYRKDIKKKRTSLQAIVSFKGKKYKYYCGVSIESAYWDETKYRCRVVKQYPEASFINIKLDNIETKLKDLFNKYELANIVPTQLRFKADAKGNKSNPKDISLMELIDAHIASGGYDKNTVKSYRNLKKWLSAYEKKNRTTLQPQDVSQEFYDAFRRFFYSHKKSDGSGYSLNYFGTIIAKLKAVLNNAKYEVSFKDRKYSKLAESVDNINLSKAELNLLWHYTPTYDEVKSSCGRQEVFFVNQRIESLLKAKNYFFIGCYTGLRVSDYKRIQEVNIKGNRIRIKPVKGINLNKDILIPINHRVREILNRGFDFTPVSEQKINKHIKEICRLAGIDEEVSKTRTENGVQVERIYKKYELVTTHTARRTFATLMVMANVQTEKIMAIMNKKDYESFRGYVSLDSELIADELEDVIEGLI